MGGGVELPNVSHCITENEVHYNPLFIRMTYAVHGYMDTANNMLYVESGYGDFISELWTTRPSGANLIYDVLIFHFTDNDETIKYALDYGTSLLSAHTTEYTDVSELPQGAREIYAIAYQYAVRDSLKREVSQIIDLGEYAEDYTFIQEVREEMFFGGGGQGGEAPPPATTWAWKGQGGVLNNGFIYVLPYTTFQNFLSDMATYYNLSIADDYVNGAKGLQIENFIIYFPDEGASYNCFLEQGGSDSTDGISTLCDYYVGGFAYVDNDGIFHNLDISDFVASLPSNSPYLEHLEEIDSSVLR